MSAFPNLTDADVLAIMAETRPRLLAIAETVKNALAQTKAAPATPDRKIAA